jgi:hypothetical protein
LYYVARVRNGVVPATRRMVYEKLKPLITDKCPYKEVALTLFWTACNTLHIKGKYSAVLRKQNTQKASMLLIPFGQPYFILASQMHRAFSFNGLQGVESGSVQAILMET